MYDSYLVVKGSLKNDVVDGEVVGFSFGVRLSNYRGVFVSLINGFVVKVDGVDYPPETQTFEVNGKPPRSLDEIAKAVWEHWAMQDTAYLHIAKPGGLEAGVHVIEYMESTLADYGYTGKEEEWLANPPKPGDPRAGGKTPYITTHELELVEGVK